MCLAHCCVDRCGFAAKASAEDIVDSRNGEMILQMR